MSEKISRRKFIKCAGAAVLAVSAAGVLAGCKKEEEILMQEITVKYIDFAQGKILKEEKVSIPQGLEALPLEKLVLPEGYELAEDANLKIAEGTVGVKVVAKASEEKPEEKPTETKEVKFVFYCGTNRVGERTKKVAADAKTVTLVATDLPQGYKMPATGRYTYDIAETIDVYVEQVNS